jgi:hypothetical protein
MREFASSRGYQRFAEAVRTRHRFIHGPEVSDFLGAVLDTSAARIHEVEAGHQFWRAQLGCRWKDTLYDGQTVSVPAPYDASRMKPVVGRATEGRVNSRGIPCLYLSNRKETAMSEVRPWLEAYISMALFQLRKPQRIVDCSQNHSADPLSHMYLGEPDPQKREAAVWTFIDRAFAEPARRDDDSAEYVPTQTLAELFRLNGFDGIAYKSVFGSDGYSVALFDLNAADPISYSLFKVKGVEFSFTEVPEEDYR